MVFSWELDDRFTWDLDEGFDTECAFEPGMEGKPGAMTQEAASTELYNYLLSLRNTGNDSDNCVHYRRLGIEGWSYRLHQ